MPVTAPRTSRIPESATLAVATLARSLAAQGREILGLSVGEPDFSPPPFVVEAVTKAVTDGNTRYTPAQGTPAAREALARWYTERYGVEYGADGIIVTPGAKQSIALSILCIADRGDEVIVPTPGWVSYESMIELADAKTVLVPGSAEDGFDLDLEAIEAAITPRTRAVLINSPNNPTGAVYSQARLDGLGELARRHDLWIISDDIYGSITYDDVGFPSVLKGDPSLADRTIAISGISKSHAVPGWRMGFAAGPREVVRAMSNIQSHVSTSTCALVQAALPAILAEGEDFIRPWIAEYDRRRQLVGAALGDIPGFRCGRPKGAFYFFPSIEGVLGKRKGDTVIDSGQALCTYLLEEVGVALVPGEAFFVDGYVRLSFATSMEVLDKATGLIRQAVEALD